MTKMTGLPQQLSTKLEPTKHSVLFNSSVNRDETWVCIEVHCSIRTQHLGPQLETLSLENRSLLNKYVLFRVRHLEKSALLSYHKNGHWYNARGGCAWPSDLCAVIYFCVGRSLILVFLVCFCFLPRSVFYTPLELATVQLAKLQQYDVVVL